MKDYIHKEFPKSCDPKDFFGQVKRTVNGKPVSDEQIQMIINAIDSGLKFNQNDKVLDIGCGNGALATLLFDRLEYYVGVDFSEYLIKIAKENFEVPGKYLFKESDALAYVETEENPTIFTKAICYGVFSYFEKDVADSLLSTLHDRFVNLDKLYIGNLPDRDLAHKFYYDNIDYSDKLDDNQSPIGIWRSKKEVEIIANKNGWTVEFHDMPENYYSAHYRFDVILKRI